MMSILTRVVFSNTLRNPKTHFLSPRYCPKGDQTGPKSRVNSYVLTKYVKFVRMFKDNLEKHFPGGMKFFQVFSVGLRYFKDDCKILYGAFKKFSSEGGSSLSRKELEVYYKLPQDIARTGPLLIIGAGVPFGAFALVVAYQFPRQLLTCHFWSQQQKTEFTLLAHKRKLEYYKVLLRSLECELGKLEDNPFHKEMLKLLESLKNGKQPDVDLILSCKQLFEDVPYSLRNLSRRHIVALLKIYNMHNGWRRIKRLEKNATLLKLMDVAIVREGGLEKLTKEELMWNSFIRGLNPIGMKKEDIVKWMTIWLSVSERVDEKAYSLLLHCPIFLAYNQSPYVKPNE